GLGRGMHVLRAAGGAAAGVQREDFGFRTDSVAAQIAALRAGAGITACYVNIAIRERDLVPVMADTFMFRREMWLVTHPGQRTVRRTRLLFDHLAGALTAFTKDRRPMA